MRWRAKLSTRAPESRSPKPSSSSADDSGRTPASSSPMATVRIMAPNTSQAGGSFSSARGKPSIERTPRGPERLVGLQHDRELGEVEAADMDQRACPLVRGHADSMGKGVADLAQRDQPERRRQV